MTPSFAYGLGATLYMPVIHPAAEDIFSGNVARPSGSVVLCLEDALHETDVETGLRRLRDILRRHRQDGGARVFVRPRTIGMAEDIAAWPAAGKIDGIVAPKLQVETAPRWLAVARAAGVPIMPTLETPDHFDPGRMIAVRDILAEEADRVAAVRLGGNDFLSAMGLRRERGVTAYEGPLAWVLSMASSLLISSGLPVAAPVHDVIDDLDTLAREAVRDVAAGFVSKTAIHPCQVPVIEAAFRVEAEELNTARMILDNDVRAVFRLGGVMCEPATHRAWARRIEDRAAVHGVRGDTRDDIALRRSAAS